MTESVYCQIENVLIIKITSSEGYWYGLKNTSGTMWYSGTFRKLANARKRAAAINKRIKSNTGN